MRMRFAIMTAAATAAAVMMAFSCVVARAENIVFPPGATGVIDVTRPPYSADRTGKTDCTQALIRAYDAVVNTNCHILYFPNGTYRVSDTVVYSAPITVPQGAVGENCTRVRMIGQSEAGAVIRLADHAPGFEVGAKKPVVSFGKSKFTNAVASNFFEHLTIDTGAGNPGAVGLLFQGANNAAVRNVTLRSGDKEGAGAVGLLLPIGDAHGLVKNMTVTGFDRGVDVVQRMDEAVAFEHLTLTGQREAGFVVQNGPVSIRDLRSRNRVPAVRLTGIEGQCVLLDSRLEGGEKNQAAIERTAGDLFARSVVTAGYGAAVRSGGAVAVSGPKIGEYLSDGGARTLFPVAHPASLNLPVEETPGAAGETTDLSQWESVRDHGATGDGKTDDSAAIQAALDLGKSVVYFPPGEYLLDGSLTVPASVRRINFLFAGLAAGARLKATTNGAFRIGGGAGSPHLVMENLYSWAAFAGQHALIDHASTRTLVLRDMHQQRGRFYFNSVPGGKVFIENCSVRLNKAPVPGISNFVFTGQKVWARWLNVEYASPEVTNDRSALWVLGFKDEPDTVVFETRGGGSTEILGGCLSNHGGIIALTLPAVVNTDSNVSFIGHTSGRSDSTPEGNRYWNTLVKETRNGVTRTLTIADLPPRGDPHHVFVPLYIGKASINAPGKAATTP